MLQAVRVAPLSLSAYGEHLEQAQLQQIEALAEPLRGRRVVHVNATPDGGGVAELPALLDAARALKIELLDLAVS